MTPTQRRHLAEQSAWRLLDHRLSDCPAVKKFSTPDWDEPSTLVHSLADLEESFQRYVKELLPRLLAPNIDESSIEDVLYDITEELRHVLYHIQDPRFFRHLIDKRSPDAK
jgi:hypothetical protein